MRKILLLISDTHGGSKGALMPPDVVLTDETPEGDEIKYIPKMTAWQERYWKLFTAGIEQAKRFANDDEILVLHNGDLTEGKRYPQNLVSTRDADQITIATANLKRLAEIPNVTTMRIATGTEAHNFGENTADILVGGFLQKDYPNKDIAVVRHGLLTYNDLTIDYAHHGPGAGSRNWLRGNVARYYVQSLMRDDIDGGKAPPKLVTRGHIHQYIEETVHVGRYKTHMIISPSFSAITDHTNQACKSPAYLTNGMTAVEIIDGDICRTLKMHLTTDVRRKEVV